MGRLSLSPVRSAHSVDLDDQRVTVGRGRDALIPPFVRWDHFYRWFADNWQQGQHVTAVGETDSGKTTLLRTLLPLRTYVIVFATKKRDPSLYEPLRDAGYHLITSVAELNAEEYPRVIFKPPLTGTGKGAVAEQAGAFSDMLQTVYDTGGYACYFDEIRYLSDNLGLRTDLETLYLQGRSLGVTMIAGTQAPVSIPTVAFDQARHFFFWQTQDGRRIDRMSEFLGRVRDEVAATVPELPEHEALYVNKRTGDMFRTRVHLPRGA